MKYLVATILLLVSHQLVVGQNTFPASGNVGIGITPTNILTIKGSASTEEDVVNITNNVDQDLKFRISSPGASVKRAIVGTSVSTRLSLGVGGANEHLTVVNGGNIGIGTVNPVVKLQLDINSSITDYAQVPGSVFMRNNSTQEGNLNGISFGDANGWGVAGITAHMKNVGSHTAALSFWTRKNGAAPAPQMTVDENGNVGLGTSSPGYRFDLRTLNSNEGMNLESNAGGSSRFLRLFTPSMGLAAYNNITKGNDTGLAFGKTAVDGADFGFVIAPWSNSTSGLRMNSSGNVSIGTAGSDAMLTVNGTIHGKEVKVDLSIPGPDYVFEKNYSLPSLESVKSYIDQNKHLPEVPSAKEMEANGINLSEMNMLLLKKVEELTLYILEQDKRIQALEKK